MKPNYQSIPKTQTLKLDQSIIQCDANSKFIALANISDEICIFSLNPFSQLFSKKFDNKIMDIQFHPRFYDVFSMTSHDHKVYIFYINSLNNKIETKVIYISSKENSLLKTKFSAYQEGKNLATLSMKELKIWNIDNYYDIYNINLILDFNDGNYYPFNWSESGKYLIYKKNPLKIEVFSLESKSIVHHLNTTANNCFFLEKSQEILVINQNISIWDTKSNKQTNQFDNKVFFPSQCDYEYYNSLLYLFNGNKIFICDMNHQKIIFEYNANLYKNFNLLKDVKSTSNLNSKLLFFIQPDKFEIFQFFLKEKVTSLFMENVKNEFWKNSKSEIQNNYEHLSYNNNFIEEEEVEQKKKYLQINEISNELSLSKDKTLEEIRIIAADSIKNFKEKGNIENDYINYLKNLIKDNTNKDLLLRYLKFIKKNNDQLKFKYEESFESFDDEIIQYQACFQKIELEKELEYNKTKSELDKLKELLSDISKLNTEEDVNNFINNREKELRNFRFNQPISFDNNIELYYCRCRIIILYNLKMMLKKNQFRIFKKMKYCINEVLHRNLLSNNDIITNYIKITSIIISIVVPQKETITKYNLNLIAHNDINISKEDLIKLGFQYNNSNKTYEKDGLSIKEEEISFYNLENLKLYFSLESFEKRKFQIQDFYKYEKLNNYLRAKFDENKIRNFLTNILTSNVIKESFTFFYGNNVKYPFIQENEAKNYLNKYLKFIPLKSETTSGVTEKFSMETYIFINNGWTISKNLNDNEINLSSEEQLVYKALNNGAIIEINFHELNHNFHNYYYCLENGNEPLKTPRKREMNEREGGNNMERILFGRVLNTITLKQALYILNENNYQKSLNEFRSDFLKLKDNVPECEGTFKEYSQIDSEIADLSDYFSIRFKNYINTINFTLKDDVLGFPNYDDDVYIYE